MTTRAALAAAVRPFAPGGKLLQSHIPALDALADALGLPKASASGGQRETSPAGIDLIHSFESLHKVLPDGRIAAYPDPGPTGLPWTIGWGSTGPDIGRDTVWTRAQADARFEADLAKFEAGVAKAIGNAATSQPQFDAMVSLAYNIGLGNLQSSTLLKKHLAGDNAGAQREFGKWVNAKGKRLPGLVRRRAAEAALYGSGS